MGQQAKAVIMQQQVMVMNTTAQRESGRKAQMANITAAKAISDIIRSTLGPRSMLKMLLDPMGIIMTNDGNSILREVDVAHPAAKTMIELARTQDEEVGDGTTSVIVLAGEMLKVSIPFFERNIHPTIICQGDMRALEDSLKVMNEIATEIDPDGEALLDQIVDAAVGTKFVARYGSIIRKLAITAVKTVAHKNQEGEMDVDVKRYARIEKIVGGDLEDSCVLNGCMINKDILHHKMARNIVKPRVLLLDCPLEYKKAESNTNVEISNEEDFAKLLAIEEAYIKDMCDTIIALKPTVVVTEKGVSDLAIHYLVKAGITCLRRIRKPKLLPGGGATEMAIAQALKKKSKSIDGIAAIPYAAVGEAMEIIPQTLAANCGGNVIRVVTSLRAKHANDEGSNWGIDGHKGTVADMAALGVWEPFMVKAQTIKTAIESACLLLRIDDVHSGITKKAPQAKEQPTEEDMKGEEHQS